MPSFLAPHHSTGHSAFTNEPLIWIFSPKICASGASMVVLLPVMVFSVAAENLEPFLNTKMVLAPKVRSLLRAISTSM